MKAESWQESERKIQRAREVKGSMWISWVATPSVKEGLAAAMDSSRGREVTPKDELRPSSA